MPIILDPNNYTHYREIEEVNGLPEYMIQKMRWIKPIIWRRAGQTKVHATITLNSADTANKIIRNGIGICGARVLALAEKSRSPSNAQVQRMGTQKACMAQSDTCGTCGEFHCTNNCTNKSLDKSKLYCLMSRQHAC